MFAIPRAPLVLLVALAAGCSGSEKDGGNVVEGDAGNVADVRCDSICVIDEPDIEGALAVCSSASAEKCKQDCRAQVADVSSLCATCLLENAWFGSDSDFQQYCGAAWESPCTALDCTVSKGVKECTYCEGDQKAYEDCLRKVFPRRTVECVADFRPVAECSSICVGDQDRTGNP